MAAVRIVFLALVVLSAMVGRDAVADTAASDWVSTDQSAVRLIAATENAGDAPTIPAGLQIRLEDGWKTYWRSPGDAGFPPRIDWTGSRNLGATEMRWPAPHRFSVLGLETLGYAHEVVLPISLRPETVGDQVSLRAAVDYLTCSEICIPQHAELSLTLPPGPAQPSRFAHLIARYESQVPRANAGAGLELVAAEAAGTGDTPILNVRARSESGFTTPDVFVEGPAGLTFGAPEVALGSGDGEVTLSLPVHGADTLDRPLVGRTLTFTLVDGERAVEDALVVETGGTAAAGGVAAAGADVDGTAADGAARAVPADGSAGRSFLAILGLGFLGGLILNLMPCVLPVLSIKLLGIVSHGGAQRRTVRLSFLASAAGILASFLVLAGVLTTLKMAGSAVGWGLQFQQPWFLIAMTLVVVLFAGNLFGLFEMRLPRFIADAGERVGHVHGLGGHFLTGALATLLATPCSAPFLGTAVGFALAQGPGEIFAVFIAVGLGLAAPYLVVAAVPALATRLPRPGKWMTWLRRVLGAALAATAVWLLSVLAVQVGAAAAIVVGLLALAVTGAIALGTRLHNRAPAWGAAAAAVLLAATSFLVPGSAAVEAPAAAAGLWQPFDETTIAGHVSDGHVVLVNVTADWCITCKVNETFALSSEPVLDRLRDDGIVTMQGDWTRPSDEISRYLASFGRYGIPFDAVYGPALPQGEALPELLTPEMVISALERAAGTDPTDQTDP